MQILQDQRKDSSNRIWENAIRWQLHSLASFFSVYTSFNLDFQYPTGTQTQSKILQTPVTVFLLDFNRTFVQSNLLKYVLCPLNQKATLFDVTVCFSCECLKNFDVGKICFLSKLLFTAKFSGDITQKEGMMRAQRLFNARSLRTYIWTDILLGQVSLHAETLVQKNKLRSETKSLKWAAEPWKMTF